MPFDTQFAISVEVTKLVPLVVTGTVATYAGALKLARALQASGSDIVIEEDLAQLFGRVRITPSLDNEFRGIVSKEHSRSRLCEFIDIFSGPGPTVTRALTQPAYFAVVVQCSLLLFCHEKQSLAAAIAKHFENLRIDAAKDAKHVDIPDASRLEGTLQAIEDQTEAFPWAQMLKLVAEKLDLSSAAIFEPIPTVIFQGLLSLLPMVQYFPEEHFISIHTDRGLCAMIVWAHVILGLGVKVEVLNEDGESETIEFASTYTNVHITLKAVDDETMYRPEHIQELYITLNSTGGGGPLFHMRGDPDEDVLCAVSKSPARGIAVRMFLNDVENLLDDDEGLLMLKELAHISVAHSIVVSEHLKTAKFSSPDSTNTGHDEQIDEKSSEIPLLITRSEIQEAGDFAFGDFQLNRGKISDYAERLKARTLMKMSQPPRAIRVLLEELEIDDEDTWEKLRAFVRDSSILILALSQISNLKEASDMPLVGSVIRIGASSIQQQLHQWDGKTSILLRSQAWFEVVALLLLAPSRTPADMQKLALLSDRGWSIMVSTFGHEDPYLLQPGKIWVQRGVPWRDNVCRHKILDGPLNGIEIDKLQLEARAGESTTLGCSTLASFAPAFVGELSDCFLVSRRVKLERHRGKISPDTYHRRVGYRKLWDSIWGCQKTKACLHLPRENNTVVLEPGTGALSGNIWDSDANLPGHCILNTFEFPASKWLTLLGLKICAPKDRGRVLVKGPDCCLACSYNQLLRTEGRAYLVT